MSRFKQVNLVPDHTVGDPNEPDVPGGSGDWGRWFKLPVRDLPLHSRAEPLPDRALLRSSHSYHHAV